MKFVSTIFAIVLLLIGKQCGHAQGFANLDFEDAIVPSIPPTLTAFVPISNALPSWTGYIGSVQTTQALYNGVSLGSALISLISTNSGQSFMAWSNYVIGGSYTAVISSGSDPNNGFQTTSAAIAQTSLVPVGIQSLFFNLGSLSSLAGLSVTFNGQNLGLVPLFAGSNYETYGADISAFADTTGELRFTEQPTSFPFNNAFLDDIQFSTQSVPEPSALALSALGTLLLGFRRWRNSSR